MFSFPVPRDSTLNPKLKTGRWGRSLPLHPALVCGLWVHVQLLCTVYGKYKPVYACKARICFSAWSIIDSGQTRVFKKLYSG